MRRAVKLDISQNFREKSRRGYPSLRHSSRRTPLLRKIMKTSGLAHQTMVLCRWGHAGQGLLEENPKPPACSKQVHAWVPALGTRTCFTAARWCRPLCPGCTDLEDLSRPCHPPEQWQGVPGHEQAVSCSEGSPHPSPCCSALALRHGAQTPAWLAMLTRAAM